MTVPVIIYLGLKNGFLLIFTLFIGKPAMFILFKKSAGTKRDSQVEKLTGVGWERMRKTRTRDFWVKASRRRPLDDGWQMVMQLLVASRRFDYTEFTVEKLRFSTLNFPRMIAVSVEKSVRQTGAYREGGSLD